MNQNGLERIALRLGRSQMLKWRKAVSSCTGRMSDIGFEVHQDAGNLLPHQPSPLRGKRWLRQQADAPGELEMEQTPEQLDCVTAYLVKNKIPLTQRNWIEFATFGDKHKIEELGPE